MAIRRGRSEPFARRLPAPGGRDTAVLEHSGRQRRDLDPTGRRLEGMPIGIAAKSVEHERIGTGPGQVDGILFSRRVEIRQLDAEDLRTRPRILVDQTQPLVRQIGLREGLRQPEPLRDAGEQLRNRPSHSPTGSTALLMAIMNRSRDALPMSLRSNGVVTGSTMSANLAVGSNRVRCDDRLFRLPQAPTAD